MVNIQKCILLIGFWLIRKYLKLFKPKQIIQIIMSSKFELGERILASNKSRDLYYVGDDFYFIPKDMKT